MPDYQKAKIYKLWSPSKNLVYYGSTTQSISQRLAKHLNSYKNYNEDNTKSYYSSYLVLECEDYKIELVEEYACNNKQQLEKKEGEYTKTNECVNKCVAGRTRKEYRLDNVNKIKEKKKQYANDNADKLKEQQKQWRVENTDKINQYKIDNADKIKEQRKQWYIANADKIKEYKKQYNLKKKLEKEERLND
jgi:hypothetical protein